MATNLERTVEALDKRMTAVEQRINELQKMLSNVQSTRAANASSVAFEDLLNTLEAEIAANSAVIDQIKQRLGLT